MKNILVSAQLVILAAIMIVVALSTPRLDLALPVIVLVLGIGFGAYNRKWWQRRL